jgi:hypothetical protein
MGDGDVAIVRTDAHQLARGDLQDFLMAVEIISRVAREVPPAVRLFLVGDGSEFRRLAA